MPATENRQAEGAAAPPESVLEGRLDTIQDGRAYGWAWDRNRPEDRLDVEIRAEGAAGRRQVLGRGKADRLREDLAGNGIGDGRYAFEIEIALPEGLTPDTAVAAVASPSTGVETVLVQPGAEERLIEGAIQPHMERLGAALGVLHREQQQSLALQQGVSRALRDLQKTVAASGQENEAVLARIDGLGAELKRVQERIEGIDVFLMRFDTALHALDTAMKQAKTADAGRWKVGIAATACGAAMMLVGGIALASGVLG